MQVFCKICNVPVCNLLELVQEPASLEWEDGKEFVPEGLYVIDSGDFSFQSKNKMVINNLDLINCKDHYDSNRLWGCCGLDGRNGLNKVCINDHEIGTSITDCWLANGFIFEPANVLVSFTPIPVS